VTVTPDKPGHVSLAVYDLLGREVARLMDAPGTAGPQRIEFDANGWAAGSYMVVLRGGDRVTTRPIVLVR